MYYERVGTLRRAYSSAEKNNEVYNNLRKQLARQENQLKYASDYYNCMRILDSLITAKEGEWRQSVLAILESEINEDLAYVYPSDGYCVKLDTKISRGKIHIQASVRSTFASTIPGRISKTQGRLFQQVVSFAALVGVMSLLGINTIYIDEAFSGSSKRNVAKLNRLLMRLQERGFNLVIIAQDTSMANGIPSNRLILSRTTDNKTIVTQNEEGDISESL